jgi:hypothetical protein
MDFKDKVDDCGFHIEKKGAFCAPRHIVDKLKDFVVNFHLATNASEKTVMETLKEKYDCNSEACILQQSEIKNFIDPHTVERALKENFKPTGPRESSAWLSNFDIDDVLKQIQLKYGDKHFLHLPFQMRDFEKTGSELARLDWPARYKEGYRTFGTVMNTDESSGNGQHWFAIFGDFSDGTSPFTIEYFNSSGELPLDEVSLWMKRVKHEWAATMQKNIKDIMVTRIVNQSDNHSCGPYSLYYIISRLDGTPYSYFRNNRVGDKAMHLFRKYLFRRED